MSKQVFSPGHAPLIASPGPISDNLSSGSPALFDVMQEKIAYSLRLAPCFGLIWNMRLIVGALLQTSFLWVPSFPILQESSRQKDCGSEVS